MGPLMDVKDKKCLKPEKGKEKWKNNVKGASAILTRYVCGRGTLGFWPYALHEQTFFGHCLRIVH